MKILQIASGSDGNATYIESNGTGILIDCGVSKKVIASHLAPYNHDLSNIDAILITHEHTDHVKGLVPLFNASNADVYLTKGTFSGLNNQTKEKIDSARVKYIESGDFIRIGEIEIEVIKTFHDAREPIGFIIRDLENKLVYITDTGYIHKDILNKISNANFYIFESNHDPEMLMESDRPYETKIRIAGDSGHLSNEDSAYIMSRVVGPLTKTIMLAHMSRECNLSEIAINTYKRVFKDNNVSLDNIKLICLTNEGYEEITI